MSYDLTLIVRAMICSLKHAFSSPFCIVGHSFFAFLAVLMYLGVVPYHWSIWVCAAGALLDSGSRIWQSFHYILKAVQRMEMVIPEDTLVDYFDPKNAPNWAKDTLDGSLSYVVGLSRPLNEYLEAWPKMLFWSVDKQMVFADIMVRSMAENGQWAALQLADAKRRPPTDVNSASIGNLAWMSLHAHGDYIEQYKDLRSRVIEQVTRVHQQPSPRPPSPPTERSDPDQGRHQE